MLCLVFSCVVLDRTVHTMSSDGGAMPGAPDFTPQCGVDSIPHGSTVSSDPVGTRRWSSDRPMDFRGQVLLERTGYRTCKKARENRKI